MSNGTYVVRSGEFEIEGPTLELRWFCNVMHPQPILQQRWEIRKIADHVIVSTRYEWRDVPTVTSA